MTRIKSSVEAAELATSRFAAVQLEGTGKNASIGSSNIAGMEAGAHLANRLLEELASVVSSIQESSNHVSALAALIDQRDVQDTDTFG